MKPYLKLLTLGLAAYLIFLVATLPANTLFKQLSSQGVNATAVDGSIWNGRAQGVRIGVLMLGDVAWDLKLLPLFAAQLAADVKLARPDGTANAEVTASLNGRVVVREAAADLPIEAIVGSGGLPGGWRGRIHARLSELVLENAWPVAATGTVEVQDLTGPANQPANIGSYRVTFPADAARAGHLIGKLEDLDAVIAASGELKLSPGRAYALDILVAARPGAPDVFKQGMQYLGAPDAQGRRPFSVAGTL